MNLNNKIHRVPLFGALINRLVQRQVRGSVVGVRVYANAVTAHLGPYSVTFWPGGRGVDRYEHYVRGEGDWYRSISKTVRGHHGVLNVDRNPRWQKVYR